MHYPLTYIQADFEINRPIRYHITAKRNYFHRLQTDGQTDGRTETDGQTDRRRVRQQKVVFSKKEKNTKNE